MLKSERRSAPVLCGERREEPPTDRSRMPSVFFRKDRDAKEANKGSLYRVVRLESWGCWE